MLLRLHARRLAKDERGAAAMIFALCLIPLMGALGIAVDGARWYRARQQTVAAVDSAVLTGARNLQLDPGNVSAALAAAQSTYAANTARRARVVSDTVNFALSGDKTAVTVTGGAMMRTSFLPVIGIHELPLLSQAATQVAKATFQAGGGNQGSNIELSLMLDLTGSMCDDGQGPCRTGSKIDGLRDAARDLINIVVQDNQSTYTSRVAVVPFSTRIRLARDGDGGAIMKQLTNLDPTWSGWRQECLRATGSGGGSETAGVWQCVEYGAAYRSNLKIMPCVTDRVYGMSWGPNDRMDYTDDAPAGGRWLNAHGGDRAPKFYDSAETPMPSGAGSSAADPASHWTYDTVGYCADAANDNIVAPLSSDKTDLRNRVAKFEAGGATAGALATAWSWYMLSPKWSGIWTGPAQPGSYSDLTTRNSSGAPVLRKVAVLMTDGAFNAFRGGKDYDPAFLSSHAKQLCTAMKAQKIEIYTVGFALDKLKANERPIAEDMLKSCGTDLSHFYTTLTVPELKAAFRDIGMKVQPVRLTQ
jgi:Flp pilus assembly protein TadG